MIQKFFDVLINNGIHPGEPCGIDASLKYADDLLRNLDGMQSLLDNTIVCIIPVYNVGGCLYRSHFHRTNQPGPYASGYRGNAKNLDLNRDFVKMDTENAKSFARLFQTWKPHVLLDTHTTNGSDHQYCITLIPAQHNSMQQDLGDFFSQEMIPELYKKMKLTPYELIPYVTYTNRNPESGITNYVQSPKYSTGYAQLFNSLSFMTENHCYKPYPDRVKSVYFYITSLIDYTSENGHMIREKRNHADEKIKTQEIFPLSYELDTSQYELIDFKGYGRGTRTGLLTNETFGDYDHSKPFTKTVRYYDNFTPDVTVEKPVYYILPQAWSELVDRLKINQVTMHRLTKDTSLTVNAYYIENLEWARRSSNGHFFHTEFETRTEVQNIKYYAGDYVIPVNQKCNQLIVNQLEPMGMDSYFRWNFFDNILENREWFSPHPVLEKKMAAYISYSQYL
ncbi:MAG: M14 family zinc carboxypeptidase [Bacteroidota bacterium]|nr:M14 family zinc carboxypeptidase [Bacteroidota bacterium]